MDISEVILYAVAGYIVGRLAAVPLLFLASKANDRLQWGDWMAGAGLNRRQRRAYRRRFGNREVSRAEWEDFMAADTSFTAIRRRLGTKPGTIGDFEAEYGPVRRSSLL